MKISKILGTSPAVIAALAMVAVVATAALVVLSNPVSTGEHDMEMQLELSLFDISSHDAGVLAWSSGDVHHVEQMYDQGLRVQSNGWAGDYDIKVMVSSSLGSAMNADDISMSYGRPGVFQFTDISGFVYSSVDGGLVAVVNGEHISSDALSDWQFNIVVNEIAQDYKITFQAVPST